MLAGFGAALVILAAIGAVSFEQSRLLKVDAQNINASIAVLKDLDQLNVRLVDAETGQRGYLITGEEKYLEPYTAALPQISQLTDSVSALVTDNPEQTAHVDTVRALTANKLAELQETIQLRRTSGFEAAKTVVLTDRGKNTMDQIRQNMAVISQIEQVKINDSLAAGRRQASQTSAITVGGNLLAILMVLAATIIMGRNLLCHEQAKAALLASEERFRLIAGATNDVIWDWNLTTDEVWWNKGIEDTLGYAREDVGQRKQWLVDRIHPDDRDVITASIDAAIDGDDIAWSGSYHFKKSNGSYAVVFDRGSIQRDASGKGVRMLGSMQDVSERERAESERAARTQELERMNGLMVNRELAMRELKRENAELRTKRAS